MSVCTKLTNKGGLFSILFISVLLVLLQVSLFTLTSAAQSKQIIYVDDNAPSGWYDATHVHTIQEAVLNASGYDTIYVYNGIYPGGIIINKSLIIKGENKTQTIMIVSQAKKGIRTEVTV